MCIAQSTLEPTNMLNWKIIQRIQNRYTQQQGCLSTRKRSKPVVPVFFHYVTYIYMLNLYILKQCRYTHSFHRVTAHDSTNTANNYQLQEYHDPTIYSQHITVTTNYRCMHCTSPHRTRQTIIIPQSPPSSMSTHNMSPLSYLCRLRNKTRCIPHCIGLCRSEERRVGKEC